MTDFSSLATDKYLEEGCRKTMLIYFQYLISNYKHLLQEILRVSSYCTTPSYSQPQWCDGDSRTQSSKISPSNSLGPHGLQLPCKPPPPTLPNSRGWVGCHATLHFSGTQLSHHVKENTKQTCKLF